MDIRSGTAVSGDVKLYYEDMGDLDHPPVLLIMGLGAQMLLWRTDFCARLVAKGLRVIRYDNRDVGAEPPDRRGSLCKLAAGNPPSLVTLQVHR